MAREYMVAWTSVVTNTRHISTCPDRKSAIRDARSLVREGAKRVECFYYDRTMRQSRPVKFTESR